MKIDGINAHVDPNDSPLVQRLGCEWVRIDVNWWTIETSNNNFNWGPLDQLVNSYYSKNIKIYASLMGSPSWHRPSFNNPPDVGLWTRFCTKVAQRYRHKIFVYSLWNEPNLGDRFWTGGMKEFFQTIVVPGAQAIKNVDLSLMVAMADFATLSSSKWPEWLREAKHHLSNIDIVSIHTYKDTGWEVKCAFKYGKVPIINIFVPKWRPYNYYLNKMNRTVFLTEVGLPAHYGNTAEMDKQRDLVESVQKDKHDINVDAVFFYCLKDADPTLEEPYGLYNSDGLPKMAALL